MGNKMPLRRLGGCLFSHFGLCFCWIMPLCAGCCCVPVTRSSFSLVWLPFLESKGPPEFKQLNQRRAQRKGSHWHVRYFCSSVCSLPCGQSE
jgi:hypothetical protein